MQKLLEIKGEDWLKGFSAQPTLPRMGLFQNGAGFNPFEMEGYFLPALSATELTAPVTSPVKVLTHWSNGATETVYAHSESKLYAYLRNSPYTQSDQTAQIDIAGPNGNTNCAGAIIWNNRYIYSQDTDVRSNILPVASGSDVQILNGSSTFSDLDYRKLEIGPNKNLYVADGNGVGLIVLATGTTGNLLPSASNAGTLVIEAGLCVRDLVNDGQYLVVFADGNTRGGTTGKTTSRTTGNYTCRIYFWDCSNTSKTTADIIYDIHGDSYIIGAKMIGGVIYVFTYNGIYICSSTTPPKLVWKFTGNSSIAKRPVNPYSITAAHDVIYWGDGATNGQNVYAIKEGVLYAPYISHGSTFSHTALKYGGDDTVWAATTGPHLYAHNVGSTRGNATLQTSIQQLSFPAKLSYIKVTLKTAMSAGMAVSMSMFDSNGTVIMTTNTKSYSASGALKNILFLPLPTTGSVQQFEDFYLQINPQGGANIQRVTVYGEAIDDHFQK